MGIVGALLEAIPTYTGLSPTTFFTVLALLVAVYYLFTSLTAPREPPYVPREPPPAPVQLGDVTEEQLKVYDGTDPNKPLLMAIKGQIFDVSMSRGFYGPGGPYALFAGKDASRALAKMSFEEQDLTGDIEGLSAYELEALSDWEFRFMSKYVKVGRIVKEKGSGEPDVKEVPVSDEHAKEVPVSVKEVPVSDEHAKEVPISNGHVEEAPVPEGGAEETTKQNEDKTE